MCNSHGTRSQKKLLQIVEVIKKVKLNIVLAITIRNRGSHGHAFQKGKNFQAQNAPNNLVYKKNINMQGH